MSPRRPGERYHRPVDPAQLPRARAAIGAVASRYLAVGTPRSFGLVVDHDEVATAIDSLAAHRTWFAPRDLRCAGLGGPDRRTRRARA